MMDIAGKLRRLQVRLGSAALRSGRRAEDILLVAVTKTHPPELVDQALALGIRHIGENRVQEAVLKLPLLQQPYEGFHYIGHLQTNKVRQLLGLKPWLIHAVDSLHLAQALSRGCVDLGRTQDILLQVNVSGEASKAGFAAAEMIEAAARIAQLPQLQIRGLMTIGRLTDNPEDNRAVFRQLRELSGAIADEQLPGVEMRWLSMGMSDDFPVAIEEGANLVRLGSAIFGARVAGQWTVGG